MTKPPAKPPHEDAQAVVDFIDSAILNREVTDANRRTPLHWAACYGETEQVRHLLVQGANIEARDTDNATPLHLAAMNGFTETVQLLLSHGARTDVTDANGWTPEYIATYCNHHETAAVLKAK